MTDSTTTPGPSTSDALDLVQDSLLRRMRTMHGLYHQAVDTMELEHVNHFEREGVLPIAFSLFHYTNMHDGAFMMLSGELPVWNEEWQARVQMAGGTKEPRPSPAAGKPNLIAFPNTHD